MKIIDISTRRPVTIAMFTLAVVLFGVVSLFRLKINLLPDLTYPTLTVRTEYPGAAPAEIENLITKPIEETLGVVKSVNRVSSISRSGQSDVILEFAWGTNMDYAGLDVREKLDALELPLEVERPSVLRFDPSLDPIMRRR
jgi:HAE1 family hydrophobic/amphiphilic exporter-1